jgi:hypothetical protein
MGEDGNLTIVDPQSVFTIHVTELRKSVEWKEKGGRRYLKFVTEAQTGTDLY